MEQEQYISSPGVSEKQRVKRVGAWKGVKRERGDEVKRTPRVTLPPLDVVPHRTDLTGLHIRCLTLEVT